MIQASDTSAITPHRSNRMRVLEHLRNHHAATRADLALHCGISRPTAGVIVDKLLAENIVVEAGKGTGSLGRKGRLVTLNDRGAEFVVASIDGRHLRWARLPMAEPLGEDSDIWQDELPCPDNLEALWDLLPCTGVRALALSLSGVIDEGLGKVIFSHRLPWLQQQVLPPVAEQHLGRPLLLVQEIRALALGHLASQQTSSSFLLVDCGIGLGAAAVVNGQLMSQAGTFVGEIGHTPVPQNTRECDCGGIGCLETLLGDQRILQCPDEDLHAAGNIIGGACNTLGLEHVVLTGNFSQLSPKRSQALHTATAQSCLAGRMGRLHIDTAQRRRCRGLHRLLSTTFIDHEVRS